MHLNEIGWESMDWFDLAEDRDKLLAIENMVMNLLISVKGGEFLD